MKICFLMKIKIKIGSYTAKLIIQCYDYFGENHTPLMNNGMTAISKTFVPLMRTSINEHDETGPHTETNQEGLFCFIILEKNLFNSKS